MLKKIIVAGLLMASAGAQAGFYSGNEMLPKLRQYDRAVRGDRTANSIDAGHAQGYVTGVFDSLDGIMFCSPKGTTIGQVTTIVTQYIEGVPVRWNESASNLIVEALMKAFPCKK